MRTLSTCLLFLATFTPAVAARSAQDQEKELFWFHGDAAPADKAARAALRTDGPAFAKAGQADFFASHFLAAQDAGRQKDDPHGFPVIEVGADKPLPLPPPPTPSVFEERAIGIVFFVIGVAGWIALGGAVLFLERRPAKN